MIVEPDFNDFCKTYKAGQPQPVWRKLVADLETPVSAMLKLSQGQKYSFLFESVEGGKARGRYSILGIKPDIVWRTHGNKAQINRNARFDLNSFVDEQTDPLTSLRNLIAEIQMPVPPGLPPMAVGLFGHMGYDMVRLIEDLPVENSARFEMADALYLRPTLVAIFDNIKDEITLVTPVFPDKEISAGRAFDLAQERLFDAVNDLSRPISPATSHHDFPKPDPVSNMTEQEFHQMIHAAKEYVFAGDIFQVVLAQRFEMPFNLPAFALYRALRRLNPSPYLFFLDLNGPALVGSSPEILVKVKDSEVSIRPLAGTRPRGENKAQDDALTKDLLNDPKELAEHLMLLDLGRNDVGRVATMGSVRVDEQMEIEYYSHVMHIVSHVTGRLDHERFDCVDALFGGFPAGTVSGAPKVRAMEIIEELEPERRGYYGGTVGYFTSTGDMDTCIALRTACVHNQKVIVFAGVGVVADSDPEAEFQESLAKARAIIKATEEAVTFASSGN